MCTRITINIKHIVGILLAAGHSTRFGSDKLAYRLASGVSILEASAQALLGGVSVAYAVMREANRPLAGQLSALGIETVLCPEAEAGMGFSLACGVAVSREAQGWIVYLADMPFIRTATVVAIAAGLCPGSPIVAPNYQGRRGHPIGFSAQFRNDLLACCGDVGARRILSSNAALIKEIPVGDPGILQDVDRPYDLKRYKK